MAAPGIEECKSPVDGRVDPFQSWILLFLKDREFDGRSATVEVVINSQNDLSTKDLVGLEERGLVEVDYPDSHSRAHRIVDWRSSVRLTDAGLRAVRR